MNQVDVSTKKVRKERRLKSWLQDKINLANEFIDDEQTQSKRPALYGTIYTCTLGENIGSEQNEERPVLIISNDGLNASSSNVVVVPLTGTLKVTKRKNRKGEFVDSPRYSTHYFLKTTKYKFLTKDSAVTMEGIRSVSKIRLQKHLGEIDSLDMDRIKSKLKRLLDLQ